MIRNIRKTWPLFLLSIWACGAADLPPIPPDDLASARLVLEQAREDALVAEDVDPAERVERLTALGLWETADSVIAAATPSLDLHLATAALRLRQHRYDEAESLVERVLEESPEHRGARLLAARLRLQAWDLEEAAALAQPLADGRHAEAGVLLGRIRLLEKKYDEALEWAGRVREWDRENADAYVLEADVHFWNDEPAAAEAPLRRALELDPFNADARFGYGYAIWRRGDADRLDDMAAQWELALEADPLHLLTHWHWGNGHTNLTYADYAAPSDSLVRARLQEADRLIGKNDVAGAIELTRSLEREFPESVLPAMLRGSAFYMAYGMPLEERLDSAHATFAAILERKPHYGPAHNGIAAVIKQRQFTYLEAYDSLEAVIEATTIPDVPGFDDVFADADRYPGDRVRKMIVRQLGPTLAYVPLLARIQRDFTIPALHVDLAEAMGRPQLRSITTFDNRQWMDIRGIGGGATGIEYVERGAHWERNVLLHEYVHLYHGTVLSDAEVRRIRDLYHAAMEGGRTLDYYASNNESEFFAQAVEAYLSPVKAHPLTHKSMNTAEDLKRKDPATYAFVDSLIARQQAFLDGDQRALRSNLAQTYTILSEMSRDGRTPRARRTGWAGRQWLARTYLDSALVHDPNYMPAYLSYAALHRDAGQYPVAERWLNRAEAVDSTYAPLYVARAEFIGARARGWELDQDKALEQQVELYRKALSLETDLAERAGMNRALRELLRGHARIPDAIRTAEAYVAEAPTISTYLRDRRDEAAAFAHSLRARVGYAGETLEFFADLVRRKPQHYDHRLQYAEALAAAGREDEAIATLQEGLRILRAAGRPRADYMLTIAQLEISRGNVDAAREIIRPLLDGEMTADGADLLYARVLASLRYTSRAQAVLEDARKPRNRADRAERAFTEGWIAARRGAIYGAERSLREALEADPYHLPARLELARLLARAGRDDAARAVITEADSLPLPLGPDLQRRFTEALVAADA